MLFIEKNQKSILAEKYRQLRTSLQYATIDKEVKTLVITSSEAGEGKSTVAVNLGYILSKEGKKVIVLDCDLRRPKIHKIFKVGNRDGLMDYLISKATLDVIIKKHESGVDIITTGSIPPNPAEIVNSKMMEDFLERLKEIYDYIIIDTPPVRIVTDGAILAGKADGTLFVVRAEYAKDVFVKRGFNELKKVNANILGCIFNGVNIKDENKYYREYKQEKIK